MARPLRIEFEGAIYHITARGNERQRVFRAERDREKFVELLSRSCARFEVSLIAFVLMGNHFHLVAQTHRGNLSRWMHWLMGSYTTWVNWRYQRSGHLFQGRYKSFVVEEGEYLLELSRYVHLNPVRGKTLGQGSVKQRRERLRAYEWSSYRGTAGLRRPFAFVAPEIVLEEMGGPRRGRAVRYRRFVEEGLVRELTNPGEAVQWQAVLGSESFMQRIQDQLSQGDAVERRQGGRQARCPPERVLEAVATHYGIAPAELGGKQGYGFEPGNVALRVVWEKCGLSQEEIGKMFGGLSGAAVAQRLRRLKPESRREAEAIAARMSNV